MEDILSVLYGALMFWFFISVITIVGRWKMYEKAGKPGWASLIPIYDMWVYYEIAQKPGWWILLGLIPFVGFIILPVLTIIASIEVAKNFNKGTGFTLGLVFFRPIFSVILGLGDAVYSPQTKEDA